jgi:hypothetical protein
MFPMQRQRPEAEKIPCATRIWRRRASPMSDAAARETLRAIVGIIDAGLPDASRHFA